jgi:uncharacterized protein (UPF0210 family)
MQKIPARVYARRHRMSLFEVIKRINNGELKGETIEENGVNVQYVLVDASPTPASDDSVSHAESPLPEGRRRETAILEKLLLEMAQLRTELARLSRRVEACCGRDADKE